MYILETSRLHVDQVLESDFDHIFRLQSDLDTMRYIRLPETDPAVVRRRMADWTVYGAAHPGLGVWVMRWKESGEFAGYCVLRHVLFQAGRDLEVGYTLAPEFWGRGLATEVTQALVHYAFDRFAVDHVVAFTDPAHVVSQRVLAKCGFVYAGTAEIYSAEDSMFVVRKEAVPQNGDGPSAD